MPGHDKRARFNIVDYWVLILIHREGPISIPEMVEISKSERFNLTFRVVESAVDRLASRARVRVYDRRGPRKSRRWVLWNFGKDE
jgi:hypothetical protein